MYANAHDLFSPHSPHFEMVTYKVFNRTLPLPFFLTLFSTMSLYVKKCRQSEICRIWNRGQTICSQIEAFHSRPKPFILHLQGFHSEPSRSRQNRFVQTVQRSFPNQNSSFPNRPAFLHRSTPFVTLQGLHYNNSISFSGVIISMINYLVFFLKQDCWNSCNINAFINNLPRFKIDHRQNMLSCIESVERHRNRMQGNGMTRIWGVDDREKLKSCCLSQGWVVKYLLYSRICEIKHDFEILPQVTTLNWRQ